MRRNEHSRWICLISALFVGVTICLAQYRAFPGKLDAVGLPTSPARICLGAYGTDHCYTAPSDEYTFGLDPEAHTVAKLDGRDLILFTATFSAGGSGLLTNLALLEERGGEFANLLPVVQLSEQSEYKLWRIPEVSSAPVLVATDFIWDFEAMKASNYAQQTHFAHHRYAIKAYVFSPGTRLYEERLHFETRKKCAGLDDTDRVRVLDAEKPAIVAKLKAIPSH
jgi:hypothetical protein